MYVRVTMHNVCKCNGLRLTKENAWSSTRISSNNWGEGKFFFFFSWRVSFIHSLEVFIHQQFILFGRKKKDGGFRIFMPHKKGNLNLLNLFLFNFLSWNILCNPFNHGSKNNPIFPLSWLTNSCLNKIKTLKEELLWCLQRQWRCLFCWHFFFRNLYCPYILSLWKC